MKLDIVVESKTSTSVRARQVAAMFDAPVSEKCRLEWNLDLPIEESEGAWNVGLIVGPSGSGKSTVMRHVWGEPPTLAWDGTSVVDDFDAKHNMETISEVCGAVGFNTIPAWMRPFKVLSNGEQFRVDLARRLLELKSDAAPVVVDEFTSVVDRQVAQIGAHAVQKYVRRNAMKFVAVACHYDIIDWLQPDWVLDMATRTFTRRLLQQRPAIDVVMGRVSHAAWGVFAPYHYMTGTLHIGARCYGAWANGRLASFIATLHFPHPSVKNLIRISRGVTLPDWQGAGLQMKLLNTVASAHAGIGNRIRAYPAHPAWIRAIDRTGLWSLTKEPGGSAMVESNSRNSKRAEKRVGLMGDTGCATFEWIGPAMPVREAERFIAA